MGMIFGRISEEMPKFTVISQTASYEVRRYVPGIAASCKYGAGGWGSGNGDGAPFRELAKYIGVFSAPANTKAKAGEGEKIAMTAPVLIAPPEPIAMTAPVLIDPAADSTTDTMMFVLPASKYSSIDQVPVPSSPNVKIVQLPERVQAARTFSGNFRHDRVKEQLQILLADLDKDGWQVKRAASGEAEWTAAGYNAPFVIPFCKTNEVLVSVIEKQE